jgi:hypothetical protein
MDDGAGACAIPDAAALRQIRRQALWVHVKSFVSAFLVTVILLLV